MTLYGTEISFRLGPGSLDEARAVAARLAAAAAGCRRHVLFVDADAGEYGCLAEWERREDAEGVARGSQLRCGSRGVATRPTEPKRRAGMIHAARRRRNATAAKTASAETVAAEIPVPTRNPGGE